MHLAVELEFFISITKGHLATLPEDTIILMIEYLSSAAVLSPMLAHQLDLASLVCEAVSEHKESRNVKQLIEQQIVPQLLNSFLNIK